MDIGEVLGIIAPEEVIAKLRVKQSEYALEISKLKDFPPYAKEMMDILFRLDANVRIVLERLDNMETFTTNQLIAIEDKCNDLLTESRGNEILGIVGSILKEIEKKNMKAIGKKLSTLYTILNMTGNFASIASFIVTLATG